MEGLSGIGRSALRAAPGPTSDVDTSPQGADAIGSLHDLCTTQELSPLEPGTGLLLFYWGSHSWKAAAGLMVVGKSHGFDAVSNHEASCQTHCGIRTW